jgi:hypothetical protein
MLTNGPAIRSRRNSLARQKAEAVYTDLLTRSIGAISQLPARFFIIQLLLPLNHGTSYKGLQYQAAYTWSHLIDNSTAEVASTFLTPRRAENFFNLGNEKASSALDRRQRFTLSLLAFIPDQKLPYSINYNLTVEHVFAKDYTLDVGYIGTKGVHLITQQQINRQSPVTATQNIPTFLSTPSATNLAALPFTLGQLRTIGDQVPLYANAGFTAPITSYTAQGYSNYNALTVNLKKRLAKQPSQ